VVALPDAGNPDDRVVVRRTLTYYRWTRTDPARPGEALGIEHGTQHVTLVLEVHRDAQGGGWLQVGALGPQVAIPENAHLAPDGTSLQWRLPAEGHNDPRMEQFAGELRGDEPIRAYLWDRPESVLSVAPGPLPAFARLPASGLLPRREGMGQGRYDAALVWVLPVRTRRGGRYLLQVFDMLVEPGGFTAGGVLNHLPTRAEVDRFARWMRDPAGMNRGRPPPLALTPLDRY
jgi:hypothetical protein